MADEKQLITRYVEAMREWEAADGAEAKQEALARVIECWNELAFLRNARLGALQVAGE